jgi:hypothetical protein
MKAPSPRKGTRAQLAEGGEIRVKIEPFGPSPEDMRAVAQAVMSHEAVQKRLAKTRNRLLSVDLIEPPREDKPLRPKPPEQFRATIYDYTNNVTLFATGSLAKPAALELTESAQQPLPTNEEFDEAVRIITEHAELGAGLREQRFFAYRPMPPLVNEQLPDGRIERTITVGLLPREGMKGHEIVAVNMVRRHVIRFEQSERGRAPETSAAHNPICGIAVDAQQPTTRNAAGTVWITVTQGGTTVWKFQAIRPAASSGTNGSGIELRYIDYKGKRLLYRAHVPILNVKYNGNACGPYRDWQQEEGMINATGADVAPGFRLCPSPATTILDTGSDTGNYLGVAVYVKGQEVVLVSEMQAGWYRYISEWRLHTDGTIRPRFGFTAVKSSCVCNVHHHHAYWRFDFDIRTSGGNLVQEFNDPPIIANKNWHDKNFEIRRPRDPGHKRKWRVSNKTTGEAYDIIPGHDDGVATSMPDWPYPRGDVWILRYHGTEIDDGSVAIGPPYEVGLDSWVNGEAINGQDVVIWYGAHFTHDVAAEPSGDFGHIVGPDLKLVKW